MMEAHVAARTGRNELARFAQDDMSAATLVPLAAVLVADRSVDGSNRIVRKVPVRVDVT